MKINLEEIANLIEGENPVSTNEIKSKLDMDDSVFMLIHLWSQMRSKDPNTKVGAAVYDFSTGTLFMGYNGFNADMPDRVEMWKNRNVDDPMCKYNFVVHAEANAVKKALQGGFNPEASVLYITHQPCHRCLVDWIVASGIKKVRYLIPHDMSNNDTTKHVIDVKDLDIAMHQSKIFSSDS